ncbi:G-protein coupled receptor, partial [Operophtera brumata]
MTEVTQVRNATAIFIINLSVSDLLFACTIFPVAISLFLKQSWSAGRAMCWLLAATDYGLAGASVFTIVAITINRYVMVSHPIHYLKMYQRRNIIIMIVAIWVGAISMVIPMVFEIWGRFSLDPKVGFCTIIRDQNGNTPNTLLIVMGFVFPFSFIVVCYSRIMYIVKKSTSKSTSRPLTSNVQSDSTSRNQDISTREPTSSGNIQEENNCDDVESNSRAVISKFKKSFKGTFRVKQRRMSSLPTRRDKRLQTMIMAIMISFFMCHLPILIAKTASNTFWEGPYGNMMSCMLLYLTTCSNPQSDVNNGTWNACYKGLDQYGSDEELASVSLFLDFPDVLLKFTAACCIIFMIVGIPGNIITIVALSKYRKSWSVGRAMCWLFAAIKSTLTGTSMYTIMAITINRYVMVLYQTRNLIIMIIAIWVCAIGIVLPILFEIWGRFSLDPKKETKTVQSPNKARQETTDNDYGYYGIVFCVPPSNPDCQDSEQRVLGGTLWDHDGLHATLYDDM